MKKKLILGLLLLAFSFTFISCTKKETVDDASKELFEQFANGEMAVSVCENYNVYEFSYNPGYVEGTVEDFKNYVIEEACYDENEEKNVGVSYDFKKYDDGLEYALFRFSYVPGDFNFDVLMRNNNGTLEIVYEDCDWSRRSVLFLTNGIVWVSGSNGAASHVSNFYYVDSEGKTNLILSTVDEGIYFADVNMEKLEGEDQSFCERIFIETAYIDDKVYHELMMYDENFEMYNNNEEDYKKAEEILKKVELTTMGDFVSDDEMNKLIDSAYDKYGVEFDDSKIYYVATANYDEYEDDSEGDEDETIDRIV